MRAESLSKSCWHVYAISTRLALQIALIMEQHELPSDGPDRTSESLNSNAKMESRSDSYVSVDDDADMPDDDDNDDELSQLTRSCSTRSLGFLPCGNRRWLFTKRNPNNRPEEHRSQVESKFMQVLSNIF